ncbi:hypothetical protein RvY_15633 [Ramazzottius varieornatus]|uniref:Uncharacterized protein n=1 Tax=Ramazzottius varieornatus TaxID=947166 RepID=A0A1D1VVK9_RAMVA|nr:hypothetical protein RvY_15633 [Ramazzottius varieornatus]
MFGGMIGAYAPYQMSGLTTGVPMGFPLGHPFSFSLGPSAGTPLLGTLAQPRFTADEWLILQGMTATQPAAPSISPGAPAIQPSSVRVSQASSYHASTITNSPVGTGRPDVKTNLGSIGPPITVASAINRLNTVTQTETEVGATVGVAVLMAALTDAVVFVRAAMALDGAVDEAVDVAVDIAVDVAATREVDVLVTDNEETAPGTKEEGGPRKATRTWTRRARWINLSSVLPGSEGEPKSPKKTLATDSKNPTTHMDQLEHQTGNDGASRTWKWTSENLDEGGKNAPSFLVW